MNTDFQTAYLKSLNLIQQEEKKEEKDKKCPDCGKEPCECDDKEDVEKECGTTDANDSGKVINDDVDEQEAKEAEDTEDAPADDAEDSDDSDKGQDKKDEEEQSEDEESATCFCFKTTNKTLIDAINSGFDKVTFTVKAKDDEGNDTTTDVEFTNEDFADFEECDECEDDQEEESDDIADDIEDIDDEFGDVDDEVSDKDDDETDTSFESVFKRYYGAIVGESKKKR